MATLPPGLELWEPTAAQRQAVVLVAERFGLLAGALVSRRREARLIRPRFAALWVLRAVWPQYEQRDPALARLRVQLEAELPPLPVEGC